MIFDNIYNLFKIKTDGEEFDSDDDALTMANVAYRKILALRDWIFLKKTISILTTTTSYTYSIITDLDKPLAIWYGDCQLKKATFEKRKDTSYDYWIDYVAKKIMFISDYTGKTLDLDYKFRPDDLDDASEVTDLEGQAIAYQMIIDFFEKDQDTTVYQQAVRNLESVLGLLTEYNESLRA